MNAVVDAPPSRRIKELEVMVADVVVETPDPSTLVFFTGNDHLEYSKACYAKPVHDRRHDPGSDAARGRSRADR
jgi:hypothetical protein